MLQVLVVSLIAPPLLLIDSSSDGNDGTDRKQEICIEERWAIEQAAHGRSE